MALRFAIGQARWAASACLLPVLLVLSAAQAKTKPQAQPLPEAFKVEVLDRMAQSSLLARERLAITRADRTTWKDCPHPSADRLLSASCLAIDRRGWRVEATGGGETWVYYVTHKGLVMLDAPASLNPNVQAALAQVTGVAPQDLKIQAAEPYAIADTSRCVNAALCKVSPIPGWKILLSNSTYIHHLNYQGKAMPLGDFRDLFPANLSGLPQSLIAAALRDIQNRHGTLSRSPHIESVQPLTWSLCGGGPTPPDVGMCPMVQIQGWQMQARAGGLNWVYYWSHLEASNPETATIPDGTQSFPRRVDLAVRRDLARRDRLTMNDYRVHRAIAGFFDRCLNRDSDALHCRQGIQSGWTVTVFGGPIADSTLGGVSMTTSYASSLEGQDLYFLNRGRWSPPPRVSPATHGH